MQPMLDMRAMHDEPCKSARAAVLTMPGEMMAPMPRWHPAPMTILRMDSTPPSAALSSAGHSLTPDLQDG